MGKPTVDVSLAIVRRNERWLVAKRKVRAHLGGLWEFPGGRVERNETHGAAALRELLEECDVQASCESILDPVFYEYEDRVVRLTPVVCRWISGDGRALGNDECRWVTTSELRDLAMPDVNAEIIRELSSQTQ